jgi:uncharacterized YceG family protein
VSPLFKRGSDDDGGHRSAEERARDRAERAAKRAAKRGEPPPDLFDLETAPPKPPPDDVPEPALAEASPPPEPEPAQAPPSPEPTPPTPNAQRPTPNPPPPEIADDPLVLHRPEPQATAEIPLDQLPDGGESFLEEVEEPPPEHEPEPELPPEPEPSLPTPDARRPTPEPVPPTPNAQRPTPPTQQRGGARKWLLRITAVLSLALAAAAIWFAVSLFQPFKGDASSTRVTIGIPKGADAGKIGDLLERRGVISSSFFFGLRARLAGKRKDLKPGTYRLRQDSSYGEVLDTLSKGPPPIKTVAITIPEGRSRAEEARRIRANSSLQGSYLTASKRSRQLNPRRYGAPRGTPSLEGFLFPATYQLRSNAPVKALVTQQVQAFKRAIRRVPMRHARKVNLTTYDVLIIASMVEREAMLRRERPIIAGVMYNRLKRNIPLGIDATIRYATGNWLRPLTQSQLAIRSPYNTRTHQGLPPTPIGSPGLASIRAAAHPKRTPYLYYVVKPGGCGEHVFATTFAAFQRASARYNAARSKRGGRSPTKCK